MTSPIPPKRVELTATHVQVMRIKDNVARLKFGGEYWDVSILELGLDASGATTKDKLTMTDDLAQKVQKHFQELADQGVFNPKASRKVVLEGNRSTPASPTATADIKIDKVSVEESSGGGLKEVDLKTNTLALGILDKLGKSLAEEDTAMHSPASATPPPATSTATAPPGATPPSASGTTTPPSASAKKVATPISTAPIVKRNVKVDPLTREFISRNTDASATDPTEIIQRKFNPGKTTVRSDLASFIGKTPSTIPWTYGNGFEKSERFELLYDDLKHIFASDKAGLEASAAKFSGGVGSYGKFNPGELSAMLHESSPASSISDKGKRILLVQLYVQYLKDGGSAMGENFYRMYIESIRDPAFPHPASFQVAILEEQDGKIKLDSYPKGEPLRPSECLFLKKTTDPTTLAVTITPYRQTQPGHTDLARLKDFKAKDIEETVHHDVGAGGQCADRSLAYQLLMKGKPAGTQEPTQSEIDDKSRELRTAVSLHIKSTAFTGNPQNVAHLHKSLKDTLTANALPFQQARAEYSALALQLEETGLINVAAKELLDKLPGEGTPGSLKERLKGKIYELSSDPLKDDSRYNYNYGQHIIDTDPKGDLVKAALAALIAEKDPLEAICEKDLADLTSSDKQILQSSYAALILQPTFQLDEAFFAALSEIDETPIPAATPATAGSTPAPANKHKIAIIQDNTDAATSATKPYNVTAVYPPLNKGDHLNKDDYLFIWYDRVGHYHTMDRDSETLRELISSYTVT